MTVHTGWTTQTHGVGSRLRSLVARVERVLLPELGAATYHDRTDPTSWGVEPFPGPTAGSGHVRVLTGSRPAGARSG